MFAKARDKGWTNPTAVDYEQIQRDYAASEWHGTAARYEWNDELGDVAPRVPELEQMLFGGEFQMRKGDHYSNLNIEVFIDGRERVQPVKEFADAGLHPVVLDNINLVGYEKPTPIQQYAIPAILQGRDVVAISQTGSGKTAAYMIPIISRLMGKAKKLCAPKPNTFDPRYNPQTHFTKAEPLVVIVVPTRELAIQTFDEARRFCYRSMLRPCVSYGGFPVKTSIEELRKGCDILVATPGRLVDLMDKPHILTMSRVKYTVIDEADEMLHMDWQEELNKIMSGGDTNEDADHVYMMISATFPKGERELVRQYLADDHVRLRVGRAGSSHKNIRQDVVFCESSAKREAVYDLLFNLEPARTLIFCNSKQTVDLLDDFLFNRGLPTTSIHADRGQQVREDSLRSFRTGKAPILIATGVSSRGWDIKDVKYVINYDLPSANYGGIQEYIHRIGRTARIGHQGLAMSFYNDRDEAIAQDLVNVLVECECTVPEFLSHLAPQDGVINFDDDTDEENEEENAGANTNFTAEAMFQPEPAMATAGGW
ncbi:hypothetical protein BAUCODRAFT_121063 [Baudoinia panamericana UAMH 10762]|uniref:RNA helicase n=1 Tax=Baudoinia panamericana (strain UAMH 10762) TaxID=717646 RepID=M2NFX1_BAUPA|nr:uncharacterized protein BAUCODRAFT_121063 [Baudoinia panamericana UAMH 10762]EMC98174.1 hypothetical protein BAUCODRAFT_121063 [Baudoinia panamericana UAMH 10762]